MAGDIVTVYGLLRQGNKILLQKRQNTGFGDGFYSLIGGHLEAHFSLFLHRKTPKGVFLNFFFEISNWRDVPRLCEPDKASDLAFFNAQNLPENTLDYIRHAIDCFQRGVRGGLWAGEMRNERSEDDGTRILRNTKGNGWLYW
jgi:hypothetical protein